MLKRRFGFGLFSEEEPTLRQRLAFTTLVTLAVAGVILAAMLLSGEGQRAWFLLGPVLGGPVGVLLGHLIRDARPRGK